MFRYIRLISVILMLAIATSPAFAANCVTLCASQSVISSLHSDDMASMPNCHHSDMKKHASKSNVDHKSCAMGIGCNFAVVAPIDLSSKFALIDFPAVSFPRFNSPEKSVDLSPPLKPPA